ncbi:MAG: LacI family DNA-binding transcriptional regulator [Anaerolineae bacterium]|nr:LacI family DNA-binding transcriptional regulator [Anaerolineae bacterium]
MPSVREIAEAAGVSKSTVSLVLNNKPGVSESMRQVVLSAVKMLEEREALGGANDLAEDSLYRRNSSPTYSIVVLHPPTFHNSDVFSEVLQGIQAGAERYNVQLRLAVNDRNPSANHVSYLYFTDPNLRPDGVLVFGAQQHEPLLEEIQRQGIPCVVLGREAKKYAASGIERNEAEHAYHASRYLLDLGHRTIAFVGGMEQYDFVHNRLAGYRCALHESGVELLPEWVQLGDGAEAVERLLAVDTPPTAILFVNDTYAAQGLPMLATHGLQIPHDISVISFDDTRFAREYDPPLTSISYYRYEEGQWAVKMLVDQITMPYIEKMQMVFKAQFIERHSCAPPRQ